MTPGFPILWKATRNYNVATMYKQPYPSGLACIANLISVPLRLRCQLYLVNVQRVDAHLLFSALYS